MIFSKRTLIILGLAVGLLSIMSIIFVATRNSTPTADQPGYLDPGSGEIIKSDKDSQVPDEAKKDSIIFPGFSNLIERGLSTAQIQSIQLMLSTYSSNNDNQFKEVSLQINTMSRRLPKEDSRTHTLMFNIVVNRKDVYYVTAEYSNTSTVKSTLYAADKTTQLFQQ